MKLLAGVLNAVGLGLIGFAVLRPLTDNAIPLTVMTAIWAPAGLALHAIVHYILGMTRKEASHDAL
ncbi:hypothetical protein N0B44_02485 [Roseibacterium beibuensis]|uniref:Uncharacterized protein n=1 Tax=[Roseibacterium] beibuensis TaxID=1193142 RepID=A0ABP9L1R7_9RHOB|nr:hypothetical protein [Roseibacterium beibuensis]MCS6621771.1 hypothetical protein [Roseibacterium beibuensis]